MPSYQFGGQGVPVDRPQSVIDSSPLYQLTQFARRQAGLPPLVGNDLGGGITAAVGGGDVVPIPDVLPMWNADP